MQRFGLLPLQCPHHIVDVFNIVMSAVSLSMGFAMGDSHGIGMIVSGHWNDFPCSLLAGSTCADINHLMQLSEPAMNCCSRLHLIMHPNNAPNPIFHIKFLILGFIVRGVPLPSLAQLIALLRSLDFCLLFNFGLNCQIMTLGILVVSSIWYPSLRWFRAGLMSTLAYLIWPNSIVSLMSSLLFKRDIPGAKRTTQPSLLLFFSTNGVVSFVTSSRLCCFLQLVESNSNIKMSCCNNSAIFSTVS
jgi:hypothetical protein